jgi:hypothetical protein
MPEDRSPDDRPDDRTTWNADPLTDHPIGPDDAGNGVMVGLGFLVSGWQWLRARFGSGDRA